MIIEGMSYLTDPNKQFVTKGGAPNVGGFVRVYFANTDDPAPTYSDFNGTRNAQDIRLDNNGRAVIIANASKAYRVEVYDRLGGLQWTVQPLFCLDSSGGGIIPVVVETPLVRVKFQNGSITKLGGDDGFVKENKFGNTAFFLPENVWYQLNFNLSLSNTEARDLVHQMYCEWEWATWIADDVPPAYYGAGMPGFYDTLDCTTTWTKNFSASRLYKKDFHVNDWLTYNLHLPANVPYTILLDVFKVRDE